MTLRQVLDLYACVRPVRWIPGVPSPVKRPQDVDVVIFRENTEDVYAGIEWKGGSPEAEKLRLFIEKELGKKIRPDSGIGIKPISEFGTQAARRARRSATPSTQGRDSVTLVHKGNIMKFTEGAFRDWGYEVAREEFGDVTVTEEELWDKHGGKMPAGKKVLIKDRIADSMFQQMLLRPDEYSVIAHAQPQRRLPLRRAGGPGRRARDGARRQHGRRARALRGDPRHRAEVRRPGQGQPRLADPVGEMMLEHLGWKEAADLVREGRRGRRRGKARDLRPAPPDGGRDAGVVLRLRRGHRQLHVAGPRGRAPANVARPSL